jgi:STE24 endopeptidase
MQWVGISGVGDGRSVAFLLAFIAAAAFLSTPLQSAVSREIETRADLHALNLTRDPETFAEMQRRLALTAKADVTPNWLLYRWFGTHPTATARLASARAWAQEHDVQIPPPMAPKAGESS